MDETEVLSQISNLQPCFPETSLDCDFCDGTGVIYPEQVHNPGCLTMNKCLGHPYCPIWIDIKCDYCNQGKIEFDYCFIRTAMKYTVSDEFDNIISRSRWRQIRFRYQRDVRAFCKEYLKFSVSLEASKRKNQFFFSTLAWTLEEAFVIIDTALLEAGYPLHLVQSKELIHIRKYYGLTNSKTRSKHYNKAIGDKYLERCDKARKSNEIQNHQAQ